MSTEPSVVYKVEGMTCGGCALSVTKALERLGLATTVSLRDGTATVKGPADDAKVRRALEGAGYLFGGRVG